MILPKPISAKEEAFLEVRNEGFRGIFNNHSKERCGKDGKQPLNLTPSQQLGLKSLKKRIKDHKILVVPTDKSGRFAIVTPEAYEAMGRVHTDKDWEVGPEVVADTQEILNGHVSMLLKGFGVGQNWNQTDWIRESTICHDRNVPPMYIMIKDHKVILVGKWPSTRSVISNNKGLGVHLANVVSDIVEPTGHCTAVSFESISTEDLTARHEEYNAKVREDQTKEDEGIGESYLVLMLKHCSPH